MTSYFQQKLSSVHPGSAKKNVLHSMFLFVYLFSLTSAPKTTSPPPTLRIVLRCNQARMCELLKQFLSAAVRSVTRVGCNSIPPLKKSFKLEGDPGINRLMLTRANEGATAVADQPNQSRRKDHLQPAHSQPPLGFPVITLVQSSIPSGPKAENFPEEMAFSEQ